MSGTLVESEKAIRYIQSLDVARSQGQWHQVPELARKVEKHAPHRKGLVLTARTEATAASTSTSDFASVQTLVAPLTAALSSGISRPDDAFQARVCLAWLHWILQKPTEAIALLDGNPATEFAKSADKTSQSREWLQVCAIKYAYLKGFSFEKTGSGVEGANAYSSILPLLTTISSNTALNHMPREFRLWTERLLSRCVAYSTKEKLTNDSTEYATLLQVFHHWAALFNVRPTDSRNGGSQQFNPDFQLGQEVEYSRWDMWMAYYTTLSDILKRGLVYSISYSDSNPQVFKSPADYSPQEFRDARLKQRKELKNVESRIEIKLLEETSFPKATVRNDRVERWADAVVCNWKVMCGSGWQDEDLGEGGKNAIARGVLDILYRAASKTFHSTQILRHLFTVHAYLAEFDLALKALDTYLALFGRAKQREEKSGDHDYSLDNRDTVLVTISEAIHILCRFGQRKEAEKAQQLSKTLLQWIEEWDAEPQIQEVDHAANVKAEGTIESLVKPVAPKVIAMAYHAVGTSEAHWARLTYEAATRTQHQSKAQDYFRLALHRKYRSSKHLDYQYSLAVLLAEMRDVLGAIKVVKQALADSSSQQTPPGEEETYDKERRLIRFWHLLTLLLSARSDILNAAKSSNAAFEQFQDLGVLFGQQEYRSEHLNQAEKIRDIAPALVDRMNVFEKIGILQMKMTQVTLLEALEGPASAVEASVNLLALYSRLFRDPSEVVPPQTSATTKVPKSRVGSLRASFFRRSRSRKADTPKMSIGVPQTSNGRPRTTASSSAAPTIQVTDTNDASETRGRSINGNRPRTAVPSSSGGADPDIQRSQSGHRRLQKKNSVRSDRESFRPTSPTVTYDESQLDNSISDIEGEDATVRSSIHSSYRPTTSGTTASNATVTNRRSSHSSVRTNISHAGTVLIDHSTPVPEFPILSEKRLKLTMLVELWLYIAGMYVRTNDYEDAREAINEAADLVSKFEAEIGKSNSSAKAFADRGWGGGQSVDELWGDIWAQRGELSQASSKPHEALAHFEKALDYWPNHARGVVGLSQLLLDIYTESLPADASVEPIPDLSPEDLARLSISGYKADPQSPMSAAGSASIPGFPSTLSRATTGLSNVSRPPPQSAVSQNGSVRLETRGNGHATAPAEPQVNTRDGHASRTVSEEPAPDVLNRLAARDRAYFLLSTLTKLGNGWDLSEAWYALARVYEQSGQIEKAKEVLWWVVDLEDSRPLRPWASVGLNGVLF